MKIIPVVTELGIHYEVRKKVLFGVRYLGKDGYWSDKDDKFDIHLWPAIQFKSPDLAAKEIRKQFGKMARIERWEPK